MKKTLKVLGMLCAAFVLGLGFVGCGDASVDDGTDTLDLLDTGAGSKGGSSSGGSDTIGTTWGALFENTGHSPIDIQIWGGSCTIDDDTSEGMKINANDAWFGGVICHSASVDATNPDCVFYDMSKVVKMTFEVKASKTMTASCVYTNGNAEGFNDGTDKPKNVNATTDWKTVTVERAGAAKAYAPFTFVAEGTSAGDWMIIKNVKYLDAAGNSVAVKYAN